MSVPVVEVPPPPAPGWGRRFVAGTPVFAVPVTKMPLNELEQIGVLPDCRLDVVGVQPGASLWATPVALYVQLVDREGVVLP